MQYVLFIFLFIFSFCQEVFGEDYAGSRESSGEVFQTKPHKVDEYAGHWSAELPKSCRQWGVRGETNFNIHRNVGVEHVDGSIGEYRFVGNRHGSVILGNILSHHLYAMKIDLKNKYLLVYARRNVHAEEGKRPCKVQLLRDMPIEEGISDKLKDLDDLYKNQLISDHEYSKKRLEIIKLLKGAKPQKNSIEDRLDKVRSLEEKGLITAEEAAIKRASILDDL